MIKTDRRIAAVLILLILLVITNISQYIYLKKVEARKVGSMAALSEIKHLAGEYRGLSTVAEEFRNKVYLKEASAAVSIEELLTSLNLKEKLSGIKPTMTADTERYRTEGFETTLHRLTLGELLGLLDGIENGMDGFILRSLNIKKDFSQAERLNVILEVSAIKAKAQ